MGKKMVKLEIEMPVCWYNDFLAVSEPDGDCLFDTVVGYARMGYLLDKRDPELASELLIEAVLDELNLFD